MGVMYPPGSGAHEIETGRFNRTRHMEMGRSMVVVINRVDALRKISLQALHNLGYAGVIQCRDIQEARFIVEEIQEDQIVIMEFGLWEPDGDEMEFLKRVAGTAAFNNNQLIVTSQKPTRDFIIEMVQIGIKKVIVKNSDVNDMTAKFDSQIDKIIPQTYAPRGTLLAGSRKFK